MRTTGTFVRSLTYGCTLFVFYTFNLLICHPVQSVGTVDEPEEWTSYSNVPYGFTVDIPARWNVTRHTDGVEIHSPDAQGFVSIRAVTEPTPKNGLPMDEYLITTFHRRHTYLSSEFRTIDTLSTLSGMHGYRLTASVRERSDVPWSRFDGDSLAEISYIPSPFVGDSNASTVEVLSVSAATTISQRILRSFRATFRAYRQSELLNLRLISPSETPDPGVWYVGETRGYDIDINGDARPELLIVGMRRTSEITEDKCFVRILERESDGFHLALEKSYLLNSFHENDIRIINSDGTSGHDVFLRFFDFGNAWGQNTTVVLHYAEGKYRIHDFGPFARPQDVDGDGIHEIITCTRSVYNPGAPVAWYDIFRYENHRYVERNLRYPKYFQTTLLPMYRQQIADVESEMSASVVKNFKVAAFHVLQKLHKYVRWSERIIAGKDLP